MCKVKYNLQCQGCQLTARPLHKKLSLMLVAVAVRDRIIARKQKGDSDIWTKNHGRF